MLPPPPSGLTSLLSSTIHIRHSFQFLNRPDFSRLGLQLVPACLQIGFWGLEHSSYMWNRLATIMFLERYCYLRLHYLSTSPCFPASPRLGYVWFATTLWFACVFVFKKKNTDPLCCIDNRIGLHTSRDPCSWALHKCFLNVTE